MLVIYEWPMKAFWYFCLLIPKCLDWYVHGLYTASDSAIDRLPESRNAFKYPKKRGTILKQKQLKKSKRFIFTKWTCTYQSGHFGILSWIILTHRMYQWVHNKNPFHNLMHVLIERKMGQSGWNCLC